MKTNKPKIKTTTLEEKHRINEDAYNDWINNPTISLTQICNKHNMSCAKLRAWIKKNQKKRPDSYRIICKYAKKEVLIKTYNKALESGLTVQDACKIAQAELGRPVRKEEMQYYAVKHDLPLLPEKIYKINW